MNQRKSGLTKKFDLSVISNLNASQFNLIYQFGNQLDRLLSGYLENVVKACPMIYQHVNSNRFMTFFHNLVNSA